MRYRFEKADASIATSRPRMTALIPWRQTGINYGIRSIAGHLRVLLEGGVAHQVSKISLPPQSPIFVLLAVLAFLSHGLIMPVAVKLWARSLIVLHRRSAELTFGH
jgi:hypothetical protein